MLFFIVLGPGLGGSQPWINGRTVSVKGKVQYIVRLASYCSCTTSSCHPDHPGHRIQRCGAVRGVNHESSLSHLDARIIILFRERLTERERERKGRVGERESWRAGERESGRAGERESGRAGERESGRAGERESGRAGERESGRAGERESGRAGERESGRAGERESGRA